MDRRNQRILEYHNELAKRPPRPITGRRVLLFAGLWITSRVLLHLASDRWGGIVAAVVGVAGLTALIVGGVQQRRKRLAWEADRQMS